MTWSNKTKIPQEGDDLEILTPDGYQILVGESEDLILLWQTAFNNWADKAKNAVGDWDIKSKIATVWNLKTKITS